MNFVKYLIICTYLQSGKTNIIKNIQEMVITFMKHRGLHSVIFIPDEKYSIYDIFKLNKAINSDFYLSSFIIGSTVIDGIKSNQKGGKKLVVVLDFDNRTNESISTVFNLIDVAPYHWLFTTSNLNLKEFERFQIPLVTDFVIAHGDPLKGFNLTELYNTGRDKKIMKWLGEWDIENGLRISMRGLIERRKNLEGTAIKVITSSEDPCRKHSFAIAIGTVIVCIHDRLWREMVQMLNVTTELIIDAELSTDAIVVMDADLTFRSSFMNTVYMKTRSYPWQTATSKLWGVTRYIDQRVEWNTYILPFSKQMWMAIFIWLIISDAIMAIFEYITQNNNGKPFVSYCSKYLFLPLFAFCNQEVLDTPRYSSYRIILLMMFAVPAVVLPGYSGILVSYLTVTIPKKPFRNLEGLSQSKDYRLGWHGLVSMKFLLDLNDTNPVTQNLLKNNVVPKSELPATDVEGLQKVCSEKFTYLTTDHSIRALKPKCPYFLLEQPFMTFNTAMELKKNSWYTDFVSMCLKKMYESGVRHKILLDSVSRFINYLDKGNIATEEVHSPIEMESTVLPFAILLLGVLISTLFLTIEIALFKFRKKTLQIITNKPKNRLRYYNINQPKAFPDNNIIV